MSPVKLVNRVDRVKGDGSGGFHPMERSLLFFSFVCLILLIPELSDGWLQDGSQGDLFLPPTRQQGGQLLSGCESSERGNHRVNG